MPFLSQKQRAWMHKNLPKIAKRWEKETPPGELPIRVSKNKPTKMRLRKQRKRK